MDDQERQYEELARRAQERRRMVEARRLELEQRMREREQTPEPDAPAWWDDEEEEEEEPLHDELPSPWIEEHEAPLEFPARREEAPSPWLRQHQCSNKPRRGSSNCTCGIAIAEAYRLCTERDCPYR